MSLVSVSRPIRFTPSHEGRSDILGGRQLDTGLNIGSVCVSLYRLRANYPILMRFRELTLNRCPAGDSLFVIRETMVHHPCSASSNGIPTAAILVSIRKYGLVSRWCPASKHGKTYVANLGVKSGMGMTPLPQLGMASVVSQYLHSRQDILNRLLDSLIACRIQYRNRSLCRGSIKFHALHPFCNSSSTFFGRVLFVPVVQIVSKEYIVGRCEDPLFFAHSITHTNSSAARVAAVYAHLVAFFLNTSDSSNTATDPQSLPCDL